MPESLTELTVQVNARSITQYPELAVRIGIIASTWAEVEDWLARLFILGMQTEPAVAAVVLGNVFSIHVRLNIIRSTLGLRFRESDLQPFGRLSERISKASGDRNRVVHGMWTTHKDHPNALLRLAGITDPKLSIDKYVLNDFLTIEHRLVGLHLDLTEFYSALVSSPPLTDEERTALHWRATPLPEPTGETD